MFVIDDIFMHLMDNNSAEDRQRRTDDFNLALQDKANAYNERMQREQWQRDDTAYQRLVNDMSKAGLNPLSGGSPTSSPLSFQAQAANAVAPQTIPFDFNFSGLLDALQFQEGINLQNKRLNLDAIRSGVSPSALGGDDSSVIKLFNDIQKANLKILKKEADSPYSRSEGTLEKTYEGAKNIFRDVVDSVDNFAREKTSNSIGDLVKKGKTVVNKAFAKAKASREKYSAQDVESFYKNKAFKILQTNNPLKAFTQWLKTREASR